MFTEVAGAEVVEDPTTVQASSPIGPLLHRQVTGNSKSIARKMRDVRYEKEGDYEEKLMVDTVMENPLPKPNRMRSNATF